MRITEDRFPVLSCIHNNIINEKINNFIENQTPDIKEQQSIKNGVKFLKNKPLQINYISKSIHEKLSITSNFIKAKDLLIKSPKTTGLILLPETIYPDFSNIPEYVDVDSADYPINAILYSWLSWNDFDDIEGKMKDEDEDNYNDNRELFILPIYNDGTTVGSSDPLDMINNNEIYGWEYSESEGRDWYGKIHDYVMSFILFYNYTETDTKIISGLDSGKQRRVKLNNEKYLNSSYNEIEIVDSSYFTRIVRNDEFEVGGHFRVQKCGVGNKDSKIIFIENYKKSGYSRGARIDNRST